MCAKWQWNALDCVTGLALPTWNFYPLLEFNGVLVRLFERWEYVNPVYSTFFSFAKFVNVWFTHVIKCHRLILKTHLGNFNIATASRAFYTMDAQCEARRCDVSDTIEWVEGKSTGAFTPSPVLWISGNPVAKCTSIPLAITLLGDPTWPS